MASVFDGFKRFFSSAFPQPEVQKTPDSVRKEFTEHHVLCIDPQGLHRMAYTQWGDPQNPRVLVCVHGLTRNGRDFDFLARRLSKEFLVICPDIVGRGRSDWLKVKAEYGFPLYMADMVTLLARFPTAQIYWLGTSMGGVIGMFIANYPNSPVTKLVLNDVGPTITGAALRRIGGYVARVPQFASFDDAQRWLRETGTGYGNLTEAQWHHMAEYSFRKNEEGIYVTTWDPGIGNAFRYTPVIGDLDLWQAYENINCPTLVLRGEHSDLLTEKTFNDMMQTGPQAEGVVIPDVGHAPMLMNDDQVDIVQRFLEKPVSTDKPQQTSANFDALWKVPSLF